MTNEQKALAARLERAATAQEHQKPETAGLLRRAVKFAHASPEERLLELPGPLMFELGEEAARLGKLGNCGPLADRVDEAAELVRKLISTEL